MQEFLLRFFLVLMLILMRLPSNIHCVVAEATLRFCTNDSSAKCHLKNLEDIPKQRAMKTGFAAGAPAGLWCWSFATAAAAGLLLVF